MKIDKLFEVTDTTKGDCLSHEKGGIAA